MKKQWYLFALAAVLPLVVVGCSKEAGVQQSTKAASSLKPITLSDLDKVGKSPKPYKLALIVKTRCQL